MGFPGGSDGKESACNAGDLGLIPGLGRSPGGRYGNPLQYSCWRIPMDKGVWWAIVHQTERLSTTHIKQNITLLFHRSLFGGYSCVVRDRGIPQKKLHSINL